MSFEVEQKFRVDDRARLARRLGEVGASATGGIDQEDVYLAHPCRDFAATGEALRIRKLAHEIRITYKGPRQPGPTKTREEIEFPLDASCAEIMRLYDRLGFRPVATVRKHREGYHLTIASRQIEVALDEAEGLGSFAEVEVIARDEADLPDAQAAVMKLAGELGLTKVEPRSYLRMLLDRRGGTGPHAGGS